MNSLKIDICTSTETNSEIIASEISNMLLKNLNLSKYSEKNRLTLAFW